MLYVFRAHAYYPVASEFRISATAPLQSSDNYANNIWWHK